jgi:hypothetical protein
MTDQTEDVKDRGFITNLLKKNKTMFTDEIVQALKDHKKEKATPDCNDRTMRNLISLKREGVVKGTMNREKRTWEWTLAT